MKSFLAVLAHGLRCNVVAGARLALFRHVRPIDFRVSPADFLVLLAFVVVVAIFARVACAAAGPAISTPRRYPSS